MVSLLISPHDSGNLVRAFFHGRVDFCDSQEWISSSSSLIRSSRSRSPSMHQSCRFHRPFLPSRPCPGLFPHVFVFLFLSAPCLSFSYLTDAIPRSISVCTSHISVWLRRRISQVFPLTFFYQRAHSLFLLPIPRAILPRRVRYTRYLLLLKVLHPVATSVFELATVPPLPTIVQTSCSTYDGTQLHYSSCDLKPTTRPRSDK